MNKITLLCRSTIVNQFIKSSVIGNVSIITKSFCSNPNFKPFENNTQLDDSTERIVNVAVIGLPNAGKSTLINNLIDRKVCAASSKVHTTRKVAKGICTEGNTQIVFLDTPGLVTKQEKNRYQLEESFVNSFKSCMEAADVVCVVQDASNHWTRDKLHNKIRKLLDRFSNVPSVLVLNKIDLLKSKRVLLDLVRNLTEGKLSDRHHKDESPVDFDLDYSENNDDKQETLDNEKKKGWPKFTNVFMVSSIEHTGLEELKEYLTALSRPSPWIYSPLQNSDLSNDKIITEAVRAKLLDFMPQEIPYKLKAELELYEESEEGIITASVVVTCPSERIRKLLEGSAGGKLRQITNYVTADLREAFYQPVNLVISTAVTPN